MGERERENSTVTQRRMRRRKEKRGPVKIFTVTLHKNWVQKVDTPMKGKQNRGRDGLSVEAAAAARASMKSRHDEKKGGKSGVKM